MIKLIRKITLGIASFALLFSAQAATEIFNGQTITYTGTGATATKVGGDLVLRFPANGTLTLQNDVTTRILAVVGGGSGGRVSSEGVAGGGGGAGGTAPTSSSSVGRSGGVSSIVRGGAVILRFMASLP